MHRAEAHLRRIEGGPLRIDDAAERFQAVLLHRPSEASSSQAAPSVICEELPGVMLPYFLSKNGLSLANPAIEESRRRPSSSRYTAPSPATRGTISP